MKSKTKYSGLGIALGAALGAMFGVIAGNVGVWLAIGVAIGTVLGAYLRPSKAECPHCAVLHQAHEVMQRRSS